MVELLGRYFIVHKSLGIPGIGNFYFHRHKATFDFSKRIFASPRFEPAFKDSVAAGDKHIYEFISKAQQIDYVEAIERFNQLSASLKKELNENKILQLTNIGTLHIGSTSQVSFEPAQLPAVYFPDVVAERVARDAKQGYDNANNNGYSSEKKEVLVVEKKEEKRQRGIPEEERWWLFALVLALIAMAAIFYYYYTNGSLD